MPTQEMKKVSLDELHGLEIAVLCEFSPDLAKNEVIEFSDLEKKIVDSSGGKIKTAEAGVGIKLLLGRGVLLEESNECKIKLSEHGKNLRSSLSNIESIKRT